MEIMVPCDCENMLDVRRWLILSAARERIAIIWNQIEKMVVLNTQPVGKAAAASPHNPYTKFYFGK